MHIFNTIAFISSHISKIIITKIDKCEALHSDALNTYFGKFSWSRLNTGIQCLPPLLVQETEDCALPITPVLRFSEKCLLFSPKFLAIAIRLKHTLAFRCLISILAQTRVCVGACLLVQHKLRFRCCFIKAIAGFYSRNPTIEILPGNYQGGVAKRSWYINKACLCGVTTSK